MKKYFVFLLLPAFMVLQFCSPSKKAPAPPASVSKFTFEDHVKPLVTTSCSPCHTTGNKSHLVVYSEAKEHADEIINRISLSPGEKGFMPFKKTEKLPPDVIAVFKKFKEDGALEN